jgi:formylglycine-generating enzyme required for sulfatase activity
MRYCEWLTTNEVAAGSLAPNQYYSLPSAAEWTAAAGTSRYPWGDSTEPPVDTANFAGQELRGQDWPKVWEDVLLSTRDPGSVRTVAVDRLSRGEDLPWGLGGNAAEWCETEFDPAMNTDPATRSIFRLQPENRVAGRRVVRGGSWFDTHDLLFRTATHWAESPDVRNDRLGFRVVLRER